MTRKMRGRPFTFTTEQRRSLAELLRIHGARKTQELSLISISLATLLKIAHEFGVALKKGRRPMDEGDRRHLAELLRVHGMRKTRELSPFRVSAPTLTKIAREFGVTIKRGRGFGQAA